MTRDCASPMYLHLAALLSPFATVLLYFVAPAWVAPAVAAVVSALVLFFSAYYMLVADSAIPRNRDTDNSKRIQP